MKRSFFVHSNLILQHYAFVRLFYNFTLIDKMLFSEQ